MYLSIAGVAYPSERPENLFRLRFVGVGALRATQGETMMPPRGQRPSFADAFEPDIAGQAPPEDVAADAAEPDTVCPTCGASCKKIEAAAGQTQEDGAVTEMSGLK